jgi:4-hydroxy-4-methyl-2-oxoglutarate aldolase
LSDTIAELARLGSATVYEGGGRLGYVDLDLIQLIPGSRVAGPARTVACAQGDNLMVHAVMTTVQPGDVLVITQPDPAPNALLGDLLMTQAKVAGVAGVLIDAAIRDHDELVELGVPVWARWIRVKGPVKDTPGELDVPVTMGGATIEPGDIVVMDGDGVAIVPSGRVEEVLEGAKAREDKETAKRAKLEAGEKSYELDGLRAVVEGAA